MLYILRSGDRIGNYIVQEPLESQGAMSRMYRVRHAVLNSSHALKVLLPSLAEKEAYRLRFLSEARIQAMHRHPHIVPVTDVVNEPGIAGLVMDWMDGEDLEAHLHRVGKVDVIDAVRWSKQILSALALVHRHGVIHRDLKPGNVFLTEGVIKVVDFGIAKLAELRRTTIGGTMGTFGYMSPEQIEDPSNVDPRTDLFSVGTILYEMLAGKPAFEGSIGTIITRVQAGNYPPLSELSDEIDERLSAVVDRALSVDRTDRFADAMSFAAALDAVLDASHHARISALVAEGESLGLNLAVLAEAPSDAWLGAVSAGLSKSLKRISELQAELSSAQEQAEHFRKLSIRLKTRSIKKQELRRAKQAGRERAAQELLQLQDETAALIARAASHRLRLNPPQRPSREWLTRARQMLDERIEQSRRASSIKERHQALLIYQEGTAEEQIYPFTDDVLTIGRGRDNDIQIKNDARVSRFHCRLFRRSASIFIEDNKSAHGTLVNGALITERRLLGGEELFIGETVFRFRVV